MSSTTSTFTSITSSATADSFNVQCRLQLADVYGNTLNALPAFATSATISLTIAHSQASNVAPESLQPRSFGTRRLSLVVDPARSQELVFAPGANETGAQATTLVNNAASTVSPLQFVEDAAGAPAVVAWALTLTRSGRYDVSVQVGVLDVQASPLAVSVAEATMHAPSFRVEGLQRSQHHSIAAGVPLPVLMGNELSGR